MTRHFLTLTDLTPDELGYLIQRAIELKTMLRNGQNHEPLKGKTLGMIFEKSSTRTRVSFEVAMTHFGGSSIFLSPRDTQLGRGEPIEDSARVLSRMVDAVMIRTFDHATLQTFADHSAVPVINALTDDFHPCQLLADMQTFVEHRGSIQGKKVVWVGDGNNMCASYINAANQFDFELVISCPDGFTPDNDLLGRYPERVSLEADVATAVQGAHLVVTDVWASMGQEDEQQTRLNAFEGYQVTPELMDKADPDALFMHCLPAHRGEEVSHEMMDDPRAVVWDEAENRLHAQKALLEFLLTGQH
ncbi:MAG: ornithine carbamoyltransferase [Alcanivorax borkumensis]|jgi:ornithine carbamoyltransferase|uniref:Ornithine carbamoyltransferase n=1 Tax=Alcanivorax borkumensis (strain ATCC 700651 / DSM 11573 / NCIMB 13689 / SK2) TaxID=393595 RepID=Q0VRN2_ALCBS|nr:MULTISPECIES: ornithine carbamoyltransferase [Alcanivorax]OJH08592.1 MAG: ornithine carbamoyltransferase [Alcanivorax borkumensis]BAP13590.1 ornithine carbamoyltransferase [Alcanivorax sp. NBRC 101098]CAL16166.1 ornithine carbamoyltransferase [Alcanivorax borkumensis SK2]